jgi:porin
MSAEPSTGRGLLRCAALWLLTQAAFAAAADEQPPAPASPRALTPTFTYDGSALANLHGGARTGTTYVGNLHLKLTVQGDALGMPGTTAFIDVLSIHGGHPSRFAGDAQGVSNLEGPDGVQVEELWVQHNFKSGSASLLAGIYDLNSEFYRLQSAALFLNSAFGIGPEFAQSGVDGPSIFPRTSAGMRFALKPTANSVVRAAVLDGVPVARPDGSHAAFRGGDGLLTVVELAVLSREDTGRDRPAGMRDRIGRFSSLTPYDDKIAIGAWRYSGKYPDISDLDAQGQPVLRRGQSGAYVVGERLLIGQDRSAGKRLAGFVQVGAADQRSDRFGSYVGTGIAGSGWGLMKDSDQFGVSIAHARNGTHYLRAGVERAETAFELTYLTQLSKYLTVQPDVQYVVHPNTDPTISNALVLQVRFEIAF